MKDYFVFLLRGVIFIDGQGAIIDKGRAYVVKDEKMIGIGGATDIWIIEEGEMKGFYAEVTWEKAKEFRRR